MVKRYLLAGLGVIFFGIGSVNLLAETEVVLKDNTTGSGFSVKEETTGSTIARFRGDGNVGIGTTNFGPSATGVISIGNGTAPTGGASDASMIYAKDVTQINGDPAEGTFSELFVMDQQGNETQISPHDPATGKWIFFSKNVRTGRVVRVNMEKLVKKIEEITGETFLEEWIEK